MGEGYQDNGHEGDGTEQGYLLELLKDIEARDPEAAQALRQRLLGLVESSDMPRDLTELTRIIFQAAGIALDNSRVFSHEDVLELPALTEEPERRTDEAA